MQRFNILRLPVIETLVGIVLCMLFVLAGPAPANNLSVIQEHAFIDNRLSNDPLQPGLNLNLVVTPLDSVGGSVALSGGTATFTSSNPSYPFTTPQSMGWHWDRDRFEYSHIVTSDQFPNISGTFTFTITDVNGTVQDISHLLDYLVAPKFVLLDFPTNLMFSNNSTTPTFTFTDPNLAPPKGITRAYQMEIIDASTLAFHYSSGAQLSPSFTVPSGVLVVGNSYDFRAGIIDADTNEIGSIHDPIEDRSDAWAFDFTPVSTPVPEPTTMLLLGSGLLGLAGYGRKKFFKK